MDTVDEAEGQPIHFSRPRNLKRFIIERGCPELEELAALRAKGWRNPLLKEALDAHFMERRRDADESAPEGDAYWLALTACALQQMDRSTQCIPGGRPLRFLELGCCPGGFSNYVLTKNPMSQGIGVSLGVDEGGHTLAIPSPQCSRFEIHWGDLTYYDICSPMSRPPPTSEPALLRTPFLLNGFQLAMLDGHHSRLQESASTHKWDIDRLLIAQFIIGIESLKPGGTLLVKLQHVESSITARLLYMIDTLSKATIAFKPFIHGTKGTFYAIGLGFGLGLYWKKRANYLHHLKNIWWELTYGGPDGEGRWLNEDDLDFIIDFETLTQTYLDRLIQLGRGPWRTQRNALVRKFTRIHNEATRCDETQEFDPLE